MSDKDECEACLVCGLDRVAREGLKEVRGILDEASLYSQFMAAGYMLCLTDIATLGTAYVVKNMCGTHKSAVGYSVVSAMKQALEAHPGTEEAKAMQDKLKQYGLDRDLDGPSKDSN